MQFKYNTKQRNKTIQGLRSFKDTLPKNVKKIINKKGHIYSETLNNWKYIVGEDLFKVCYPKTFKNSNKFGVSTLLIMVKRGHEVDMEYSKKDIIDKMNSFFGYSVVEKLKFISFDDEKKIFFKKEANRENVAINKYQSKINDVKNDKIKKSLIELTKVFKEKSLADIFEDIYNNSSDNKKQLDVLIREVVQFIKDGDTAVQLIPAIKEYLDIKVKNDEQLVKMAAIVQRLVVGEQKGSSEFEFGLSDKEKEDLLKSLDPVAKDLQKYTDEINSKIEPEPTKIVES